MRTRRRSMLLRDVQKCAEQIASHPLELKRYGKLAGQLSALPIWHWSGVGFDRMPEEFHRGMRIPAFVIVYDPWGHDHRSPVQAPGCAVPYSTPE